MNKKNVKNGKLSAIIAGVLMFCLFFASPSYAGETLNNTKDEIRSLFNDAASAYPAISEKAKISEENKKLEILRLEISDYLTLAEKACMKRLNPLAQKEELHGPEQLILPRDYKQQVRYRHSAGAAPESREER